MLTDEVDEIAIAENFLHKVRSISPNNAKEPLLVTRTKGAPPRLRPRAVVEEPARAEWDRPR